MISPSLVRVLATFVPENGVLPISEAYAEELLRRGACVQNPGLRPGCQLSYESWHFIHLGMEDSINSMLDGGAGFGSRPILDPVLDAQYQLGETQERRDARALRVWEASLEQCLSDRKRNRLNG